MTDAQLPRDDDAALAAEYALGLTPQDELAHARQRLLGDPPFAALVGMWRERLVALTDDIKPVAPPARVQKAIAARLFGAGRTPFLQRVWLWQGVSVAALAAVAFLALAPRQPGPVPIFATNMVSADSGFEVLAVYDPVRDGLAVTRVQGDRRPDRDIEIWAIAPGADPVSLGLLPQSDAIHVKLPPDLARIAGTLTLAVSDEPLGGSPTGAPTGEILAAGAVTEL